MNLRSLRTDAFEIFKAGVAGVEPYAAVHRVLCLEKGDLFVRGNPPVTRRLADIHRVVVVGLGKAGYPMARAVEDVLGDRIAEGVAIIKEGHREDVQLKAVEICEARHPEPDARGVRGANKISSLLSSLREDDLVIALISGGGSALFCQPAAGLELNDIVDLNRVLLASGAAIDEINAVRKHVSAVKGGRCAQLASPATVVELTLSDVVGDDPATIASGPFAPDPSTFAEAHDILCRYGIWEQVSDAVRQVIQAGMRGTRSETPKPGDPVFEKVYRVLCGNNELAKAFAAKEAEKRGYKVDVLKEPVAGEARVAARSLCGDAIEKIRGSGERTCMISGGETTVSLGEHYGKGGRNQELALAAALEISGQPGLTVLSAGTDGTDGPTDAAGAMVDGKTVSRACDAGLNPETALLEHDAYPFFASLNDLVITGPTKTNVMDLQIILGGFGLGRHESKAFHAAQIRQAPRTRELWSN
ncbi:MAG: DUF4147 domain-containing protein [Candidatus Pacebacteria bacterium]|nr:DUF4147 domain-containing protein [Candidatus Paceibacterota bacterium]